MSKGRNLKRLLFAGAIAWLTLTLFAQSYDVRGRIDLFRADGSARTDSNTGIVVWLSPARGQAGLQKGATRPRQKIVQRGKKFQTRGLAVEVGSTVECPNEDP